MGDKPIRIVLLDMPRMLRDEIREVLSKESDLVLVEEIDIEDCPDFVMVGTEDGELPESDRALLVDCPRTRVVAIRGELTVAALLATIRESHGR